MKVVLNSPGYTYDVHSLVKAFYPGEDVKVTENSLEEWKPDEDRKDTNCITEDIKDSIEESFISINISSGNIGKNDIASGNISCQYIGENMHKCESDTYDMADRAKVKSILKKCLYRLLREVTHQDLPWGTLTGIRPTKIPMKLIGEGKSDEEIYAYLDDEYMCSKEKSELATSIAHLEMDIVSKADPEGYSLYIGIPFCPTTCLYCSFTSYAIGAWRNRVGEYLEALKKEIDYVSTLYKTGPDSIYIGGGTPTTLSAEELRELIGYVKEKISFERVKELTVEAGRPDSITREKLEVLKECGVTRLSINPQTMNDKTLKVIGRRHTVDEFRTAFEMARDIGFDNINTDLILGLPGESDKDVAYTMEEIAKLSPDSITVHSMAIKRAAGMHQFLEEHEEYKSINTPQMMENAIETARSLGMEPYYLYRQKNMTGNLENIGFAEVGKYGIYNILIMEEVQTIIACGAGTVTKRVYGDGRIERCDNVKDVALYISKIEEMIDRKRQLFKD